MWIIINTSCIINFIIEIISEKKFISKTSLGHSFESKNTKQDCEYYQLCYLEPRNITVSSDWSTRDTEFVL